MGSVVHTMRESVVLLAWLLFITQIGAEPDCGSNAQYCEPATCCAVDGMSNGVTCCSSTEHPTGVGCCPIANAVCCKNGKKCCYPGYTCLADGDGGCGITKPANSSPGSRAGELIRAPAAFILTQRSSSLPRSSLPSGEMLAWNIF